MSDNKSLVAQITGQQQAKQLIGEFLNTTIPPLLLFYGPSGVGKFTTAMALVKQYLCTSKTSCGTCQSCISLAKDTHPDFICFPEKNLSIGNEQNPEKYSVRWLKKQILPYAPYNSAKRFIVLPDTAYLSHEAESALLKVLEESPEHTSYIMLSTNLAYVKQSILSRAIKVQFTLLSDQELLQTIDTLKQSEDDPAKAIDFELDELDLVCLGGSLKQLKLLSTPYYRELKAKTVVAIEVKQKSMLQLLELEQWLSSYESQKKLDKELAKQLSKYDLELSYTDVLELFSLVLLASIRRYHDLKLKNTQALIANIIYFRQELAKKQAGMANYLISKLFSEIPSGIF